jgi:acyl dehydratase
VPLLGKGYDEVTIGETFGGSMTVTETHLVLAAGLVGDFHPLHVDETFAAATRYGGRVLHGVFTAALVGGPVGTFFAGTGTAYLEHSCRFTEAVRPGDTLTTTWTVTGKDDRPRHDGGVIALSGICRNQNGVVVVEAAAKVLVRKRLR